MIANIKFGASLFQILNFKILAFAELKNLLELIALQGVNILDVKISMSQNTLNYKIMSIAEVDDAVSFSDAKNIKGQAAHEEVLGCLVVKVSWCLSILRYYKSSSRSSMRIDDWGTM